MEETSPDEARRVLEPDRLSYVERVRAGEGRWNLVEEWFLGRRLAALDQVELDYMEDQLRLPVYALGWVYRWRDKARSFERTVDSLAKDDDGQWTDSLVDILQKLARWHPLDLPDIVAHRLYLDCGHRILEQLTVALGVGCPYLEPLEKSIAYKDRWLRQPELDLGVAWGEHPPSHWREALNTYHESGGEYGGCSCLSDEWQELEGSARSLLVKLHVTRWTRPDLGLELPDDTLGSPIDWSTRDYAHVMWALGSAQALMWTCVSPLLKDSGAEGKLGSSVLNYYLLASMDPGLDFVGLFDRPNGVAAIGGERYTPRGLRVCAASTIELIRRAHGLLRQWVEEVEFPPLK